jgi:hypothetical protein
VDGYQIPEKSIAAIIWPKWSLPRAFKTAAFPQQFG